MSNRPKTIIFSLIFTVTPFLGICLTGRGDFDKNSTKNAVKTGFCPDTAVTVSLYCREDSGIIDECFSLCAACEITFSRVRLTAWP